MAITISGENNNDKILAQDGVIDQISGINIVGLITSSHINVGSNIQLGNAGIITATTFIGNVTGNVNSTSPLLLQTGGSERFRITGNNELGIAGANYGSSGQVLTSGGSGSAVSWTTPVTINNNADNRVITGTGSANVLNAESNVHVDGSGRLLVGTSTNNAHANADNAVISGTGNIGLSIMSTDSGRSSIYFGDSSSSPGSYAGFIDFIHSSNSFNIGRGNDNSLTIDSGGRLLLNTSTEGHGNADDLTIATAAGSLGNTGITIRSSTTGDGNIFFSDATSGDGETKGVIKYAHDDDHMQFNTAGDERLRITSTGDLSLRSTTQNAYLGLTANSTAINTTLGSTTGTNPRLYLKGVGNGQSDAGDVFIGSGTGGVVQIRSAELIKFEVNSDNSTAEAVTILANGRMGVGTNNPQFMIHTEGSGNNGGVRLENSHTTTTVSGNTAAGAFPHNLILSNYGGSGNADNRLVSLGFDIPTTVSHANAQIVYQATGSNGTGDLQFWLENGNTTYERARFTAAGQFLMGTTSSTGARVIIQQNSSDTNFSDQQTCADSSGMRLHNYSFSTGRYTALSMECCNSSSVQSASIIAQSSASGTSPNIIFTQRNSNTTNKERLRITPQGYREIRNYHYGSWAFVNNTWKTTITVADPGDHNFTTIKLILTLRDGSYRQNLWQGEYTIFASNAAGGPGVNYYLKEHWQHVGSGNWSGATVSVQITSGGALQVKADNSHNDAAGDAYIHILDVIGDIDGTSVATISS